MTVVSRRYNWLDERAGLVYGGARKDKGAVRRACATRPRALGPAEKTPTQTQPHTAAPAMSDDIVIDVFAGDVDVR